MSSDQLEVKEMPGSRKISCPTVSYLNLFPETGEKPILSQGQDDEVGHSEHIREEKLHTGKYLELNKYHFKDVNDVEHIVEGVHMVQSNAFTNKGRELVRSDSVRTLKLGNLCTIAVLRRQIMCDCLVLVKQFRAPLKAYTIEFPATVLNSRSNPEDLANKEISEDTGYTSTSIQIISPLTALEPDISDGRMQFVSVNIDGDDPLQSTHCKNNNQSPSGNVGAHGDIVEVIKVPISGLINRLEQFDQDGIVVDSRVYAFAIGLQKGANLLKAETLLESESPM